MESLEKRREKGVAEKKLCFFNTSENNCILQLVHTEIISLMARIRKEFAVI